MSVYEGRSDGGDGGVGVGGGAIVGALPVGARVVRVSMVILGTVIKLKQSLGTASVSPVRN